MGILDFFYPKKCACCKKIGSYLCDDCFSYLSFTTKSAFFICNHSRLDNLFSSISYNKTIQKLIYSFKHKPYLTDLKKILSDLFYEGLIQNEGFIQEIKNKTWLIVPIPLHNSKFKKRGYNQAEILAKDLAERFNFPIQNLLIRTKNTKAQFGLGKKERKENIKNAFILNPKFDTPASVLDTNIFLVDDLATTGSTLLEAAKVLKRNGIKRVIGLTLARD